MESLGIRIDIKRMRELGFVRKNSSQSCFPYARGRKAQGSVREKNPRIRASG